MIPTSIIDTASEIVIPLMTVAATAVGLWFAHNFRRRMALSLADTRRKAYARLWQISGLAAPTRLDARGRDGYLTPEERGDIWEALTDWYYDDGNGMLLGEPSKSVYLNTKHNLMCRDDELRPEGLFELVKQQVGVDSDPGLDKVVRGILSIKQLSLLRTQLKSDLRVYGQTYAGELCPHELFFLKQSGVDLRSKAWAEASGWEHRLRGLSKQTIEILRRLVWRRTESIESLSGPKQEVEEPLTEHATKRHKGEANHESDVRSETDDECAGRWIDPKIVLQLAHRSPTPRSSQDSVGRSVTQPSGHTEIDDHGTSPPTDTV